ncbi:MAG: hypothetical protein ACFFDN_49240 [Candidatus Hodarchaeota archaeon]
MRYFPTLRIESLLSAFIKAKKQLNYTLQILFKELVKIMTDYDLDLIRLPFPRDVKRIIQEKGLNWRKL